MKMRFGLGVLAYLVPTFALGFVWHLMLFQAFLFAWVYQHAFSPRNGGLLSRGLRYAVFGAILSWSFTTLAVAAKNVMTSVQDYLIIETAFTAVQWMMVGPLTALAFSCELSKTTATV